MTWAKSEGIWSIHFKVKGNRFLMEISPRFDMSDMDEAPVDLEKLHEHQLLLCRGPKFDPKDDIFLGYYPDRLLAAAAGLNVFHYMHGKLIRPKPKPIVFVFGALIALVVLLVWPTKTQKLEVTTTTAEPSIKVVPKSHPVSPPPSAPSPPPSRKPK